jgi:hypothetical protein
MAMANIDVVFAALFGAGGTGAVAGMWTIIQGLRKGKLEKEDTLIQRLDAYSKADKKARDEAEADAAKYRRQRIKAQDQAARFRRLLITHTDLENLEQLEEFDD